MDGFDLGSIVAHIRADTAQFTAAVEESKHQINGLGDAVAATGKIIAAGLAVATAAAAGFAALSLRAYSESEETMAQINQVLHTTGKEAEISGEGVDKIAKSMENYSGKTRDSILQGQIILLQFKQVTAQTLPEFSKAMVDLSQRMGVDNVTAAKSLGIALDDPTTGMARLRRSGIDFTDSQKEAIKALQATGDITGADTLLMKSLEERVGGAAGAYRNTLGGSIASAKASFKDFEITVGAAIAQYLEPLAKSLANSLAKIDWQKVVNNSINAIKRFVEDIRTLYDTLDKYLSPGIGRFIDLVKEAVNIIETWFGPSLSALINTIQTKLMPQLIKLWNILEPGLTEVLKIVAVVVGVTVVAAVWLFINVLNVGISILGGIIHWVELAIGWLGNLGGVIWNVFRGIPNAIMAVFVRPDLWLFDIGRDIILGLIHGIESMAGVVEDKVRNIANGIKNVAKKILGIFSPSTVFHDMGMNIGQGLVNGMNAMTDMVGAASSSMAVAAVAPASSIVNNAGSSSTINTSITGPINIGSNVDANRFLAQLTYNQELAQKGLTPVK